MIINPFLQPLPNLIKNQPELFSITDLQDLQKLLVSLENEVPETVEEILIDWCIERELRDTLRNISESNRAEVKEVKPLETDASKRITNYFQELSQQVKEKLEKLNQSQNTQ